MWQWTYVLPKLSALATALTTFIVNRLNCIHTNSKKINTNFLKRHYLLEKRAALILFCCSFSRWLGSLQPGLQCGQSCNEHHSCKQTMPTCRNTGSWTPPIIWSPHLQVILIGTEHVLWINGDSRLYWLHAHIALIQRVGKAMCSSKYSLYTMWC